jgi:hypothetical protein
MDVRYMYAMHYCLATLYSVKIPWNYYPSMRRFLMM